MISASRIWFYNRSLKLHSNRAPKAVESGEDTNESSVSCSGVSFVFQKFSLDSIFISILDRLCSLSSLDPEDEQKYIGAHTLTGDLAHARIFYFQTHIAKT